MSLDMAALYQEAHRPLTSYFERRLSSSQQYLAEDMASEVLEKALRSAGRFEQRGLPPTAWLFAIAGNLLIDYTRVWKRANVCHIGALAFEPADRAAPGAFDAVRDRATLEPLIKELYPDQRDVIVARFVRGMDIQSTARMLGKTDDSVRKLQGRALVSLRRALAGGAARLPGGPRLDEDVAAERSRRAVELRAQGWTYKMIADELGIASRTAYDAAMRGGSPMVKGKRGAA